MVTEKNIAIVIKILRKAVKNFPYPAVTLVGKQWNSPFLVLISCILSLRTRDYVTISASSRLFEMAKTPQDMLKLSREKIEKTIYPVGFYKTKSRNIIEISKKIVKEFGGHVPDEMEDLLSLKGVGRKTANLVLNEGFRKPGICVDTHVHRISNRFGFLESKTPNETETILRNKLPIKFWIEYNSLLVVWGQNICKPISPLCSKCAVLKYCARKGVTKSR